MKFSELVCRFRGHIPVRPKFGKSWRRVCSRCGVDLVKHEPEDHICKRVMSR
jgi:hypothetical protein